MTKSERYRWYLASTLHTRTRTAIKDSFLTNAKETQITFIKKHKGRESPGFRLSVWQMYQAYCTLKTIMRLRWHKLGQIITGRQFDNYILLVQHCRKQSLSDITLNDMECDDRHRIGRIIFYIVTF